MFDSGLRYRGLARWTLIPAIGDTLYGHVLGKMPREVLQRVSSYTVECRDLVQTYYSRV